MEQIIAFAGVIAIITGGIVTVIKKTNKVPKNYLTVVAMVIGALIGGLTVFIPELVTQLSFGGRFLAGLISGLMATGIWETFKNRQGADPEKLGGGAGAKAPTK
ncbi:holin [Staphylococcus succinus]|uniref:holin n=1 Tax=Staphylococcus succinus TaxID=61015 RepID=UPI000937F2C8|nr:holin [Staphylococcus succinus]